MCCYLDVSSKYYFSNCNLFSCFFKKQLALFHLIQRVYRFFFQAFLQKCNLQYFLSTKANSISTLWMCGWRSHFKAQVCDSDWGDCCILAWIYRSDNFAGVRKHARLCQRPQQTLYLRAAALAADSPTHPHIHRHKRYPFLRPPFTVFSWCVLLCARCWRLGGRHLSVHSAMFQHWTDECATCNMPEGGRQYCRGRGVGAEGEGCCVWAGGGGRSALSSTARAPSYMEELIHVTGGCCHSAARRNLTQCHFQVIKRAYGHGARREGHHRRRHVCQALDDGRNYVLGAICSQRALSPNPKHHHGRFFVVLHY